MTVLLLSLGTERLDELVSAVMQRVDVKDGERPIIMVCFMLLKFLLPFVRVLYVFIIMLTFFLFIVR